jgi:hypothetical protein
MRSGNGRKPVNRTQKKRRHFAGEQSVPVPAGKAAQVKPVGRKLERMKMRDSAGEQHRQASAMALDKDDEDVRPEVRRHEYGVTHCRFSGRLRHVVCRSDPVGDDRR